MSANDTMLWVALLSFALLTPLICGAAYLLGVATTNLRHANAVAERAETKS